MRTLKAERPAKVFRILLVDDNKHGLIIRKSVLEEQGYKVFPCSSPEDALIEFNQQEFDLIVTDYRMPRMTGIELISAIRAIRPSIPIVLVSGVVDVLGLDEKATGADIVIPKSSTEATHLVRAVKRLLTAAPKKPVRSQSATKRAKDHVAAK